MQFYSGPSRKSEPRPGYNRETLWIRLPDGSEDDRHSHHPDDYNVPVDGWYWSVHPAKTSDPVYGPFDTESLAIADAQANAIDGTSQQASPLSGARRCQ